MIFRKRIKAGGTDVRVYALVPPFTSRMVFGVVILVLGVLWTLDNLGLIDSDNYLRWWPVALLAFGVMRLFGLFGQRHVTVGVIAVGASLWLLGEAAGLIEVSIFRLWPVALVIVGLAMVSRAMSGRNPMAVSEPGPGETDEERVNVFAFWSGVNRKPTSQRFMGGEVTAIMGGSDIDLRAAGTPPEGAVLDMFVWMGGIEMRIPKNWRVVNELTAVMGGIEDGRDVTASEPVHTVRLRGFVLMGGVEIKD